MSPVTSRRLHQPEQLNWLELKIYLLRGVEGDTRSYVIQRYRANVFVHAHLVVADASNSFHHF